MKSAASKQFWDCFGALPPEVQALAQNTFAIWQRDARHPSLLFKKIAANRPLYSVRIGRRRRALGVRQGDTMVWFWIGTHAEYDKIIRRY